MVVGKTECFSAVELFIHFQSQCQREEREEGLEERGVEFIILSSPSFHHLFKKKKKKKKKKGGISMPGSFPQG